MNRRAFFTGLAGAVASIAAAYDPERALWVPGRKSISIPKPHSAEYWELFEEAKVISNDMAIAYFNGDKRTYRLYRSRYEKAVARVNAAGSFNSSGIFAART